MLEEIWSALLQIDFNPWQDASIAIVSMLILGVVFFPLEKLFPARRQPWIRPEWGTDALFYYGQYLVWHALSYGVLIVLYYLFLSKLPALLPAVVRSQPMWLLAVEGVILGDLLVYWFHRACHHYEFLWRFHAVHHSTEYLDWLAAHREHPLDGVFTQLFQNIPMLMLGVDTGLLAGLIVFRGAWGIFIHSNVKMNIGPLRYFLGAPELHHWHHAKVAPTPHNFANLAPWLDVIFGTYHRPKEPGEEKYPLGLVDPWPRSYFAQLLRPFGIRIEKDRP